MTHRRVLGLVIAALVAAVAMPVVSVSTASTAEAAAYRYWSYWSVSDNAWTFAQRGPAGSRPGDGAVEGWRFSVSPDSRSAAPPRLPAADAFESVCGDTAPRAGKDRVALVLDFGLAAHTRPGDRLPSDPLRSECVLIEPGTTGWSVLVTTGVAIRTDDSGMVCGFAGYPSAGCGERVAEPAAPKPTKTSKATKTPGSGGSGGSGTGGTGTGGAKGDDDSDPAGGSRPAGTGGSEGTDPDERAGAAASPSTTATSAASAKSSASPAATSSTPAAVGALEPTPTLAQGLPTASDAPARGGPLPALLGVLVLVALAIAALVRTRRFGRGGSTP